jgi:hypothetical protein
MSYAAMSVHTFLFKYINFKAVFKILGAEPVVRAALSSTSKYNVTCNNLEHDVVFN